MNRKYQEKNGYVLITPAKNEEDFIGLTIESILIQTILPKKWTIVSDGSTDTTDHIIEKYAEKYRFIQLVRKPNAENRNFGSKVKAFNTGVKQLGTLKYNYIGNLDADVSFDKDYYECILKEFERNHKLGIAGGIIKGLINDKYYNQNISLDSVAGAVQLFRKECFEVIGGGYLPLEHGGEDTAAEILARSHGYQVRTFEDLNVYHHRRVASQAGNILQAKFRQGVSFYRLGYHPIFQFIKCLYRITDRPFLLSSFLVLIGYLWGAFKNDEMSLPEKAIKYLRYEQLRKVKLDFKIIQKKMDT